MIILGQCTTFESQRASERASIPIGVCADIKFVLSEDFDGVLYVAGSCIHRKL